MKKYLRRGGIWVVLGFLMSTQVIACDICSFNLGLNPNFNRNQLGFRYRYRSFFGHHSHEGGGSGHASMDQEISQSAEFFVRWYPNPKWQLLAVLPVTYNTGFNHKTLAKQVFGVSDPVFAAYRQVFQRIPDENRKVGQRMFAGGGISVPLGTRKVAGEFDAQFSTGSGAWAVQAGAMYIASLGRITIGLDGLSRYAFSNPWEYQYGWRNTVNAQVFYRIQANDKLAILPTVGLAGEIASRDAFTGNLVADTGAKVATGTAGVEVYAGKLSISLQGQYPIIQAVNGEQARRSLGINGGIFWSL